MRPLRVHWGDHKNIHCHTVRCVCTRGHCWIMQLWFGWGKSITASHLSLVEMWSDGWGHTYNHVGAAQSTDTITGGSTAIHTGLRWHTTVPHGKLESGSHGWCCHTDRDMHQWLHVCSGQGVTSCISAIVNRRQVEGAHQLRGVFV